MRVVVEAERIIPAVLFDHDARELVVEIHPSWADRFYDRPLPAEVQRALARHYLLWAIAASLGFPEGWQDRVDRRGKRPPPGEAWMV